MKGTVKPESRIRRRGAIATGLAALFVRPGQAIGQQSLIKRVGILTPASSDQTPIFNAFRSGLHDLGYIEGSNVLLEFRLARGDLSLIPQLATELAALPVDVILIDGGPGVARIAQTVTKSIPIITATGGDPVSAGLVASHARPGGNVTGLTLGHDQLNVKRVEILRTTFPTISTIAAMVNSSSPNGTAYFEQTKGAAKSLAIEKVVRVDIGSVNALLTLEPTVFTGVDGVVVLPDAVFWNHRRQIVALVSGTRLPAIYPEREYADEGGLMAYGANVPANFRQAATYVDRILKGASPASLPIQDPAKIDFVVNLQTAKALGLTIPTEILVRADEVIE